MSGLCDLFENMHTGMSTNVGEDNLGDEAMWTSNAMFAFDMEIDDEQAHWLNNSE